MATELPARCGKETLTAAAGIRQSFRDPRLPDRYLAAGGSTRPAASGERRRGRLRTCSLEPAARDRDRGRGPADLRVDRLGDLRDELEGCLRRARSGDRMARDAC